MPSENLTDVDPDRLEEHWVEQPRLMGKYSEQAADARLALGEAKSDLELAEAELFLKVKADPAKYDLDKPTEAMVKAKIVTFKRYQEAAKAVRDAQHRVHLLDGIVNTIEHRKRTLEGLVDLHGQGYFAAPRAKSAGGRESMEEAGRKSARKAVKIDPPRKKRRED